MYAAGITSLAMIQSKEKCQKLVPHTETPSHPSEHHARSIGQLIAGRIKYNPRELNIVMIEERVVGVDVTHTEDDVREIKKLIQMMTCVEPEDRLTAEEVLQSLEQV